MALLHCNFFSESLGMAATMDVILPESAAGQIGMEGAQTHGDIKTLYLLHGLSDDHTIWQRRTSIERYVAPLGIAVVMPGVHRSYYTDMCHGQRYWTFISEEVPAKARHFFRLSARREDNFVAGLSMGGYGAFKLALRKPGCFAAAASLSGALNVADRDIAPGQQRYQDWQNVFGDTPIRGAENDLFACADRLVESNTPCPRLFQCCGAEDFLYGENTAFREKAESLGLPLTYEEGPGAHSWDFWDRWIQRVLEWLNP